MHTYFPVIFFSVMEGQHNQLYQLNPEIPGLVLQKRPVALSGDIDYILRRTVWINLELFHRHSERFDDSGSVINIGKSLIINPVSQRNDDNAAIVQLLRLTSNTPDIVNATRLVLPHIFRYQGWLWIDPMEDIKKKRLMAAVDQITDAYRRHTITLGKTFTKSGSF